MRNNIFRGLLCLNFGSNFVATARHAQFAHRILRAAHIASDFTCNYSNAAETILGTTDVYELGFSITIFTLMKI